MSGASQAFSGYGLSVGFGGEPLASPPVLFQDIAEIQQVAFSGSKVDLADVTNTQSPNRRREYIATLIDSGELTFNANFIPSDGSQAALRSTMDAAEAVNWLVTLPNSLGTLAFAGIITSLDRNLDFSKEAKLSGKVKITGPITESF